MAAPTAMGLPSVTADPGLNAYLDKLASAPLLTPQDERALATRLREGTAEVRRLALESPVASSLFVEAYEAGSGLDAPVELSATRMLAAWFEQGRNLEQLAAACRALRKGALPREALSKLGPTEAFYKSVEERQRLVLHAVVEKQPVTNLLLHRSRLSLRELKRDLKRAVLGSVPARELASNLGFSVSDLPALLERLRRERASVLSCGRRQGVSVDALTASAEQLALARSQRDEAYAQLFHSNLRLVVWMAKRYAAAGMALADLVQEGNFGLMRAVERFDPDRGVRFSTYASWWVRQSIQRALANQGRTIRLPVHVDEFSRRVRREAHRLSQDLAREPTLVELSEAVGSSIESIEQVRNAALEPKSLQGTTQSFADGEGAPLQDFVADPDTASPLDSLHDEETQRDVAELLDVLTTRERYVICQRFGIEHGDGRTLREIALTLGVTHERVRQIQLRAFDKLRRAAKFRKVAGTASDTSN